MNICRGVWRSENKRRAVVLCQRLYIGLGVEFRSWDLHNKHPYPLSFLGGSTFVWNFWVRSGGLGTQLSSQAGVTQWSLLSDSQCRYDPQCQLNQYPRTFSWMPAWEETNGLPTQELHLCTGWFISKIHPLIPKICWLVTTLSEMPPQLFLCSPSSPPVVPYPRESFRRLPQL